MTPHTNAHFRVSLGDGHPEGPASGFCEVVLPALRVPGATVQDGLAADAAGGTHLILRRGVTGALNLAHWWHLACKGKAPKRRTVKIELLTPDHSAVVMTWRFMHARPVALAYAPLQAMSGAVLIESITLAFDSVTVR